MTTICKRGTCVSAGTTVASPAPTIHPVPVLFKSPFTLYPVIAGAISLLLLSACQTLPSDKINSQIDTNRQSLNQSSETVNHPPEEPLPAAELVETETLNEATAFVGPLPQTQTPDATNENTLAALPEQHSPDDDSSAVEVEVIEQAESNSAWSRLQKGMGIPVTSNKRIQTQLDWFVKNRSYLDRVMKRAEPVLPFVLDVLEEKQLPTELALLPIVESAYQTFAYSHGRASGMWQIIPSTGKHLGLKQNWWYDGRRDIIDSTQAATDYLQSLAKQFDHDWELALAAYNAGPGRIRSEVRKNKKRNQPTDFWHLQRLRRETKEYVPKLLALKLIFESPEKYGIELLHIDDEHRYEVVETGSQIDLALAADLAGLTSEEIYQINPGFNRWATDPEGPHRLLLPKDRVEQFSQKLAEIPPKQRINWIRYKIRSGDTLSEIATKYRTTVKLVRQVNQLHNNRIRAGKYLLIPTSVHSINQYALTETARKEKIKNTPRGGTKTEYTVVKGDSFWSIAKQFGTTPAALAKWNGMAPIDTLKIGEQLVIWQTSKQAQVIPVSMSHAGPPKKLYPLRYTVRKGDSLSAIASRFKIRVADIKKWNTIGKYLQPGQQLKLYVDITRQSG